MFNTLSKFLASFKVFRLSLKTQTVLLRFQSTFGTMIALILAMIAFLLFILNVILLIGAFYLYILCTVMAIFCQTVRRHAAAQQNALRWLIRLFD